MPLSALTHLLTSSQALRRYAQGQDLTWKDLHGFVFFEQRDEDRFRADYVHKGRREVAFKDVKSVGQALVRSIAGLADEYLEVSQTRVYVKNMEPWQNLLTRISPTLLLAGAAYNESKGCSHKRLEDAQNLVKGWLVRSSLPATCHPELDDLIRQEGLYDLHMHLNGTTESDTVWQYALQNPHKQVDELIEEWSNPYVREYFFQLGFQSASDYYKMLITARQCRDALVLELSPDVAMHMDRDLIWRNRSVHLGESLYPPADLSTFWRRKELHHPFEATLPIKDQNKLHTRQLEAFMYLHTLNALETSDGRMANKRVARYVHQYLLNMHRFNSIIVQQQQQVGFDQFQKIAMCTVREAAEKTYADRFKQLQGMEGRPTDVRHVEGRFAPKKNEAKNEELFKSISNGFDALTPKPTSYPRCMCWCPRRDEEDSSKRETEILMDLRLVAHFIKDFDADNSPYCRHHKLRRRNRKSLAVLKESLNRMKRFKEMLVGIDAANNEMATPPELFAPVFRACREMEFSNFTFHAGEDFEHLVSGIRAVHEALTFLELSNGNRIGHGTALGISPVLWRERMGREVYMAQGEWLDNLVWMHSFMPKSTKLSQLGERLRHEIQLRYYDVYKRQAPHIHVLEKAWRLRDIDPLVAFDDPAGTFLRNDEVRKALDAMENCPEAYAEYKRYHRCHDERYRIDYSSKIAVPTDWIEDIYLEELQDIVVQEMRERGCIVEVMPTSNVRISLYDEYREHHVFSWLDPEFDRPAPDFCFGTDDTGIFSTNLRNEFTLVAETLYKHHNMVNGQVLDILKRANHTARVYKFEHDMK